MSDDPLYPINFDGADDLRPYMLADELDRYESAKESILKEIAKYVQHEEWTDFRSATTTKELIELLHRNAAAFSRTAERLCKEFASLENIITVVGDRLERKLNEEEEGDYDQRRN